MNRNEEIDSEERIRRFVAADGLIDGYRDYFGAWVEIVRRKTRP